MAWTLANGAKEIALPSANANCIPPIQQLSCVAIRGTQEPGCNWPHHILNTDQVLCIRWRIYEMQSPYITPLKTGNHLLYMVMYQVCYISLPLHSTSQQLKKACGLNDVKIDHSWKEFLVLPAKGFLVLHLSIFYFILYFFSKCLVLTFFIFIKTVGRV